MTPIKQHSALSENSLLNSNTAYLFPFQLDHLPESAELQ